MATLDAERQLNHSFQVLKENCSQPTIVYSIQTQVQEQKEGIFVHGRIQKLPSSIHFFNKTLKDILQNWKIKLKGKKIYNRMNLIQGGSGKNFQEELLKDLQGNHSSGQNNSTVGIWSLPCLWQTGVQSPASHIVLCTQQE